jgi:hypothetical protein
MGEDLDLNDFTGERSVGYTALPARTLVPWTESVEVNARNMSQERMDDADGTTPNSVEAKRNPLRCASDVLVRFKAVGFDILHSLTGLDLEDALEIFDVVLPEPAVEYEDEEETVEKETYLSRLVDTLSYLQANGKSNIAHSQLSTPYKTKAEKLLTELMVIATRAYAYQIKVLNESEAEVKLSAAGKPGKKGFDDRDDRYYFQTRRTREEEKPGLATVELGKTMAREMGQSSSNVEAVVEQMAASQQAAQERFDQFMFNMPAMIASTVAATLQAMNQQQPQPAPPPAAPAPAEKKAR